MNEVDALSRRIFKSFNPSEYKHSQDRRKLQQANMFEDNGRFIASRLFRAAKERRCSSCWMRDCVCICDRFRSVEVPKNTSISILMHPGELFRGSNTGHLIPLVMQSENIQTVVFGVREEHERLRELLKRPNTVVLFPCAGAIPLPEAFREHETLGTQHLGVHFVVVDGTWRTARKLVKFLNDDPTLPQVTFVSIPDAENIIFDEVRKRTREDGCSTIEAIATALESIGDLNSAKGLRSGLHVLSDALSIQRGDEPMHGTYRPEEIMATRRRIVAPYKKYDGPVSAILAGSSRIPRTTGSK
mmetsp:Transcript_12866/g.19284  ORF Transcript_12866/g.19284 Transcript_12866/m.19284 type:complete len:301 (+) Transcript_12866:56-958(+)